MKNMQRLVLAITLIASSAFSISLFDLVKTGTPEQVKEALSDIPVNKWPKDSFGNTLLMLAVASDNVEVV